MEGFFPVTKSLVADAKACPYHAAQKKIHGVMGVETPAGRRGKKVQDHRCDLLTGKKDLDGVIGSIAHGEDYDEVTELLLSAVNNWPCTLSTHEKFTLEVEKFFSIDAKGKPLTIKKTDPRERARESKKKGAILHGNMDVIWQRDNGVWRVEDLKTGRYDTHYDPFERLAYMLGAKALHPDCNVFEFALFFCRTGAYPIWQYQYHDGNRGLLEIHPNGHKTEHHFAYNPLMVYLEYEISKLEKMEEIPNPGPHCESWYGEPCQFLGNGCPAGKCIPEVVNAVVAVDQGTEEAPTIVLLRAIADGDEATLKTLTHDLAASSYAGAMQLEAFAKRLRKNIESWSFKNGALKIGDSRYGWFTTDQNEVDGVFVLGEMIRSKMPLAEIVKAVNISKTSLQNLSKRHYGELRELLLSMAVTVKASKPKFGVIRDVPPDGLEEQDPSVAVSGPPA